jgi:hypothetical protein
MTARRQNRSHAARIDPLLQRRIGDNGRIAATRTDSKVTSELIVAEGCPALVALIEPD